MITGACAGGVLLALFALSVARQWVEVSAVAPMPPQRLQLPCQVEGTYLLAKRLVRYEGPFREDGTDEEVADVAALVLENHSGLVIDRGAVILEWEGARMVFELSELPPGARMLVLEKDRQAYPVSPALRCYGWTQTSYPEYTGSVAAVQTQQSGITVINRTAETLSTVTVRYKSYDPGSGMYIGGITYTVELSDLQPWERRLIEPYRYAADSSRIVEVTVAVR